LLPCTAVAAEVITSLQEKLMLMLLPLLFLSTSLAGIPFFRQSQSNVRALENPDLNSALGLAKYLLQARRFVGGF